ncbi:MAG: gamma-glutamyltransferase [Ignavibacteria bacterium]|nr:gamma-glutamyltransferase [Ignavibacteria bacterium]
MKNKHNIYILLFLFSILTNSSVTGQWYSNGVVSSADVLTSEVGIKILKEGGNAIDAAVGLGFALAVVYPQAGNIGGGGFFIIHFADGREIAIDFRETAPLRAHRDMYLDSAGNVIENLSTKGNLATAVPGSVAGLLFALEKYGTMKRQDVMKYAIKLAEEGFQVSGRLANSINSHIEDFKMFPGTMKIFGKIFQEGDTLIQTDLANTLKEISEKGRDGFYKGKVADIIVNEMKNTGGLISHKDLQNYKPKERDVLRGTYRGYKIITMPPPSSGGICLIYLLNILEKFNLRQYDLYSAENIHLMTEAMRRVYADRSEHLGDPDFYNVQTDILISKDFAEQSFSDFDTSKATLSDEIKPMKIINEGSNTTHFSIADKHGNLVSATTTINDSYGNKVVVDGAGFFLNNEMDDLSVKPGVPNIFGLLGNEANAIEPGKRPLSSMTPTIVFSPDGKPFLVLGSPGGGRIITTVLHTIIRIIDFNMELEDAVDFQRFHHQWYPDEIQIERETIDGQTQRRLIEMGHNIKNISKFGRVDAIIFSTAGLMKGYSDSRGYGKAIGY